MTVRVSVRRRLRQGVAGIAVAAWLGMMSPPLSAQQGREPPVRLAGDVSFIVDGVPAQDAAELRTRLHLDFTGRSPDGRTAVRVEATVEGLVADRGLLDVAALQAQARDIWIERIGERIDVRAGYGRIIWGRLDEIAPSDVINPLDIARFLLEGRSEARRAVPFVRSRLFFTDAVRLEAVLVPGFRRGTFDALDEDTSPFNLVRTTVLPPGLAVTDRAVVHLDPETRMGNVSGGARVSATAGRLDFGLAAYRGVEAFGVLAFIPDPGAPIDPLNPLPVPGRLVEQHTRFTMLAADFETVRGVWAWRGEAAVFPERSFAGASRPGIVSGRSVDAGVGFDREAGSFRVFGTLLFHHQSAGADPAVSRTDVSVVGSLERSFGRERWLTRAFVLVNPADRFAFVRALLTWRPVDNIGLEASAGFFGGTSDDTIGRFSERDFAFGRAVVYF
jgi:hypothetical protein